MKDIEKTLKELQKIKKKRHLMTLSKMKSQKILKVDRTEYQETADVIRSDQVPAAVIVEYFSDKHFYKWYKKKYLND
tara:strand:+ start:4321 stop:4551 length:231 start_codon:yes stop_codon:yes gene_type:complete